MTSCVLHDQGTGRFLGTGPRDVTAVVATAVGRPRTRLNILPNPVLHPC